MPDNVARTVAMFPGLIPCRVLAFPASLELTVITDDFMVKAGVVAQYFRDPVVKQGRLDTSAPATTSGVWCRRGGGLPIVGGNRCGQPATCVQCSGQIPSSRIPVLVGVGTDTGPPGDKEIERAEAGFVC